MSAFLRSEAPVEFGVVARQVGTDWEGMVRSAQRAEEAGFDSVWLIDHLLGFPPQAGILEGWTALAGLAVATTRVDLGFQVLCQSFRPPGLLAKMATTLDLMSGGRLRLVAGAGWYEDEYRAFGFNFPPPGQRVEELIDALHILRGLLDSEGKPFSYEGARHQVRDAPNLPPPQRRVPLGVGGAGDRMLGVAARLADEWNCPAAALTDYDAIRTRFDRAAEKAGREVRRSLQIVFAPGDVDASALVGFNPQLGLRGSVDQMVERVGELAAAGVGGLYGMVVGRGSLEVMAEALPALRAAAGA